LPFRKRLGFGNHVPPIAIDRGVDTLDVAGHEIDLPSSGTITDDADLAAVIPLSLQVPDGRIDISDTALVGDKACCANPSRDLLVGARPSRWWRWGANAAYP